MTDKKSFLRLSASQLRFPAVAIVAAALVALPFSVSPAFAATYSVALTSAPAVGVEIHPVLSHKIATDTYTYSWTGGSTDPTFTPVAADIGHKIVLIVTQHDSSGSPDVVKEAVTTHSTVAGTIKTVPIIVEGSRHVGQTLDVVNNDAQWKPTPTSNTWQWFRNGQSIAGATTRMYTLATADLGSKITVKRVGMVDGYTNATLTSKSTQAIGLPNFTSQGTPRIAIPSGVFAVGETAIANVDDNNWLPTAGLHFTYEWTINGQPIAGATTSSLVVPASAAGQNLGVRVVASATGVAPATVSATFAAPIAPRTFDGTFVVSVAAKKGTPAVNSTLTVSHSGVTPTPTTYTYQWFIKDGQSVVPIAGATKSTYKVSSSHHGQVIEVVVYGTRVGYLPVSASGSVQIPD
jgi:hypothetical protein